MSGLIDTTEMYLRTILELEEEGVVPMRARIAERLDQSGPTVSQTVARMERDGLLHVANDRHLELTDKPLGAERMIFSGTMDQVTEDVRACAKIGASEVFFDPTFTAGGQSLDRWMSLLEDVKPLMNLS